MRTLAYFPQDKIWNVGQMSTKALVRQKGVLIDNKGNFIDQRIKEIKIKISSLGSSKVDKGIKAKLKQELIELLENSKTLIDLSGTILLFFEAPDRDLWNLLKPILSHDRTEIEYPYVDKTQNEGLVTKKVVVRGWPACIFCSAKDESDWTGWPEVMSRFIITSPNMNQTKYLESNMLIAQTQSLPRLVQENIIISASDEELARQYMLHLLREIQDFSRSVDQGSDDNEVPIWIPYGNILGEVLRSEKGTDNRVTKRLFAFIKIIAISKAKLRQKLIYAQDEYVIASLEDLTEALYITQNISGIPAYKLKFYREMFLELFRSKEKVDTSADKTKSESIIAVTVKQLSDYYREKSGRAISAENIRKKFLNELLNHDYIGSVESVLDRRQNIYYPLVELDDNVEDENQDNNEDGAKIKNLKNSGKFRNFSQYSRITSPKNCRSIPENWLIFEILGLAKYGIDLDSFSGCIADELNNNNNLKLLDKDGNRLTIKEFTIEYEKDTSLIPYFRKGKVNTFCNKSYGYIIYLGEDWQEGYKKLRNQDIFLKFRKFDEQYNQRQKRSQDYDYIRHAWILEALREIKTARKLGIDLINFHANINGMFYGEKRKIVLDNMIKSLREIVGQAKKYKVEVMLENVPLSKGVHSVSEFKYIIDNVDSLLVHLDIPHAFTSGGMDSVIDYINTFGDKIIHIHWHDNHGQKDEHLPVGEGLINHQTAVKTLKDIGYDRTITLEVFTNSNDAKSSADKLKTMWSA
ncbi:MAG: sugar phosphate isomerase/epimerase family protein [Nitrososphaeraceae archaeon]